MRKEHVSETTVQTWAWESVWGWHTDARTSESYMNLGPNCLVRFTCGYDDRSKGSDVQDILSSASSQQASEINP